jgi:hypothetical protein
MPQSYHQENEILRYARESITAFMVELIISASAGPVVPDGCKLNWD